MGTGDQQRDRDRITSLAKSKDLGGLETGANEILEAWRESNGHHADLLRRIADTLSSEPLDDDRQYVLAERYAILALERVDVVPMETVVKLLRHVAYHPSPPKGGDELGEWCAQRSAKARSWLHAWMRVHEGIDEAWDPEDRPAANLAPPDETGLPSGVAPEGIKDPKLRAEYETAIQNNRRKSEEYMRQTILRTVAKRDLPQGEERVVKMYSTPPYDLDELERYLRYFVRDETARARMSTAVRKRMGG